jgi:SAM-dependent methyltransferase
MDLHTQRVDYDLIANSYDEPGRNYATDPQLIEFLAQKDIQKPLILDMGCGTGKQLTADHEEFPELQMIGLDLFHGMLFQAYKRCKEITWIQGDSTNPPFGDNRFDYITNQFSYHHVQNKCKMIAETCRILKPGGRFVITNLDPWSMAGWIVYNYFPASWKRDLSDFFPVDDLKSQMEKTGFCNVQVKRVYSRSEENLNEFLRYASQRHRTSQLIAIEDREYEDGIAKLRDQVVKFGNDFRVSSEISLVRVLGDKPEKDKW